MTVKNKKHPRLRLDEDRIDNYYRGKIYRYSPRKKRNKTPILYVPGYSSSPKQAEKAIRKIGFDTKREVFSYWPVPGELNSKDPVIRQWEPSQIHNAVELISVVTQHKKDDKPIDVVGHSQGALSAILAAEIQPKLFESLILVAPAGFMEQDTEIEIARRMLKNILQYRGLYKKGNNQLRKLYNSTLRYLIRYKWKAAKEGLSLADQRITQDDIERLSTSGIKIALILSNDDKVFPYELMTNTIPENIKIEIDEDKEVHQTIHSSILFDDKVIDSVVANLK